MRAVFETNVMGLLSVCQAVAPGMAARQSGTILNVASIAGLVATPFGGAYCATKAAVIALSDALRVELAPLGVRVSCVCPGAIRSKFADNCRVGADELGGLRLYAPWRDAIVRRQGASQRGAAPTPAGEFALRVVAAMGGGGGGSTPPPLFCVGTYSTLFRAVAWLLPRWARDALLARLFMSRV